MNSAFYLTVPVITCNILFYSIMSLSNSITSTQNVINFICEHKDNEYIIYKNELKNMDLIHKMKIINELILDTIKKYIKNEEDYNKFLDYINNIVIEEIESECYNILDVYNKIDVIKSIDKPILYAIISISEIIQHINVIINNIKNKIMKYEKIYFKFFINLSLKTELHQLKFYNNLLDMRYKIYIDLLKIYLYR